MNNESVGFIFDTNAFTYVADHIHYDAVLLKLNKQNKQLIVSFSIFNLYEFIRGIKTENELAKRKKYFRRIKEITLGGAIFPDPITHLHLASGQITTQIALDNSKALVGVINNFIAVKSIQMLKDDFGSLFNKIDKFIKRINDDSAKVKNCIREWLAEKPNNTTLKKRLCNPPNFNDYDIMMPQLLENRYNINIEYLPENRMEIFNRFPSVKYLCDIYWEYFSHLSLSKAKPLKSDILDLAQAIYLNIADFFVTRDKRLRDLINYCGNVDLKGRAISPEVFISMLDNRIIVKRAPQRASNIWVPPPW
jgi:hypothetical protein